MAAYVGVFFSGLRRQTCTHSADPLLFIVNSQINILPLYAQTTFGCYLQFSSQKLKVITEPLRLTQI